MQLTELMRDRKYLISLNVGALLFVSGFLSWIYLSRHLQGVPSARVFDYVLSVLPVVQNSVTLGLYVYLYIGAVVFGLAYLAYKEPKKLPLALAMLGVFVIIGNLFFVATVLEPPQERPPRILNGFDFDKDLFPSKHVGLTFLLGLLTQVLWLRYLLFGVSVILGIDILLLHIHYSFDILGGYVVAYAVYKLSEKYLKKWFEFSATEINQKQQQK
jgi:membrane-associated phospholipid phosphatase